MSSTQDQAITVAEVAERLGVSCDRVRQWTHRGHLRPLPHRVNGSPAYRLHDVLLLERERRRNPDTPIGEVACAINESLSHSAQ